MNEFKPVTRQDGNRLRRYYAACDYGLCEYSLGTKLMWRNRLHPSWMESNGCLIIRNEINGEIVFDYPVPDPEPDGETNEDAALDVIEECCMREGIPPVISVVPESKVARLLARYPYAQVKNIRSWQDYIYYREDLQLFAGRRYSGQRNHIRKFHKLYPDAVFTKLTADDKTLIQTFWQDYELEFPKNGNPKAEDELKLAKRLLETINRPWFIAGGILDGEKLIALSLAEYCGNTLIIHIEKALYSYTGVYPTLVQEFAENLGGRCRWINREDDAADRGLRTSKMQYGPAKLAPKYHFAPQNELLCHVDKIPVLQTARLTLDALRESDIPAYNALVLDKERNRWWGWDDVGSLNGPVQERSFYEIAERDFANRMAVNFAIRLDGQCIGEAVLYHFDYRGGAELGCRIDRAHSGQGYGTEAFAAVADWGLYQVNLTRVLAKCYRENAASYKMLSSCMRKRGEDETFFYFEKFI